MLPSLLSAAQLARARFKPGVITYSRKVFLPLTNLCRDYCGYCTFRRDPGEAGAHTMTPDEVMEVVRAGERMGCTEALFSLGDKPELLFPRRCAKHCDAWDTSPLSIIWKRCARRCFANRALLPHPNPGLMSAEWLERLSRVAPSMGLMLETTSARLLAKDAAHDNAPDKEPAKRLRVIEDAGRRKIPFTTGILIGIGETLEERVDSLVAIRDLHEKYGHIQEVIVQNFRAKSGTPMAHWPEPDRREMLRTLAVARLLMPRMNIQAPPNLSDPALCRPARWRHQRLGRSFAADAGFHQSGKALAASGQNCSDAPRRKDSSCASGCRFILNSQKQAAAPQRFAGGAPGRR